MGYVIGIVVWTVICVMAGIYIAGANPGMAARWDSWRRKALEGRPW